LGDSPRHNSFANSSHETACPEPVSCGDEAVEPVVSPSREELITPQRPTARRPLSPQMNERRAHLMQRKVPSGGNLPTPGRSLRGDEIDEHWCRVLRKFSHCPHWALVKEKRGVYRLGHAGGRRVRCAVVRGFLQVQTDNGFLGAEAFLRRFGAAEMGSGHSGSPATIDRQPLSTNRVPPSPVRSSLTKPLAKMGEDARNDAAIRTEVDKQMQEIAALRAENDFLSRLSRSATAVAKSPRTQETFLDMPSTAEAPFHADPGNHHLPLVREQLDFWP